ncbi:hypothetical protein ACKLNR_008482 [Fusarium oxysporum f. sp. zingiberi]
MKDWLYESISNILDWTCATIPVGHVDLLKDPKPSNGGDFKPLSSLDRDNWNLYSPELYSDAPICLQVLGQKFTEEKVLACLRVIEA